MNTLLLAASTPVIQATDVGAPNVSLSTLPHKIITVLLFGAGILAVIFLLIGALQYTTSSGDPKRVAGAKNTILYSIIGLIIVVLAYAIVGFVVKSV